MRSDTRFISLSLLIRDLGTKAKTQFAEAERLKYNNIELSNKHERAGIVLTKAAIYIDLHLLDTTADEVNTSGPDQTREEVTGLGTKIKNKNLSNSGFSGGSPLRLMAA